MNQTADFFSDIKEWSSRKLNIIKKYVDGFSRILGSKAREIYYIDGFAGRGIYDNGEKGSPVLAAELAQEFRFQQRSYTLRCVNVEKYKNNYNNLCAETQRFGNLVRNFEGSFEDNLDKVLFTTGNTPAIFF